jgi:hypothetical protein
MSRQESISVFFLTMFVFCSTFKKRWIETRHQPGRCGRIDRLPPRTRGLRNRSSVARGCGIRRAGARSAFDMVRNPFGLIEAERSFPLRVLASLEDARLSAGAALACLRDFAPWRKRWSSFLFAARESRGPRPHAADASKPDPCLHAWRQPFARLRKRAATFELGSDEGGLPILILRQISAPNPLKRLDRRQNRRLRASGGGGRKSRGPEVTELQKNEVNALKRLPRAQNRTPGQRVQLRLRP